MLQLGVPTLQTAPSETQGAAPSPACAVKINEQNKKGARKSGSLLHFGLSLAAAEIAVEAAAVDADGLDFIAVVVEEDFGASARRTLA